MPGTPSPRDQLPAGYAGPWIATFRDGPLADHDHDRIFAVGPVWEELRLFPLPTRDGWALIGGDGIPEPDVSESWPGEITYRLEDVVTMAGADGEPVAYYELAK